MLRDWQRPGSVAVTLGLLRDELATLGAADLGSNRRNSQNNFKLKLFCCNFWQRCPKTPGFLWSNLLRRLFSFFWENGIEWHRTLRSRTLRLSNKWKERYVSSMMPFFEFKSMRFHWLKETRLKKSRSWSVFSNSIEKPSINSQLTLLPL